MLLKIKNVISNDILLQSSIIALIGGFIVNILNFVFTVISAKMLDVDKYGDVVALFSLLILFAVPATSFSLYLIRELSSLANNNEAIKSFLQKSFQETISISFLLWFIFILLIMPLHTMLQIPVATLFLFSTLLPLVMISTYHSGFFQGQNNFLISSKLGVILTMLKLSISFVFLYVGFSVNGVLLALILSYLVTFCFDTKPFQMLSLKELSLCTKNSIKKHFVSTIFLSTLLLALLSNIDILLAKYFLSPYEAGAYAALSTLGKIVIFALAALVSVMFPMVAQAHAVSSSQAKKVFLKSILYMSALGLGAVLFLSVFSKQLVHILFGQKYEVIIPFVSIFSLAMFCMAISIACINYFIAIKNKIFVYFLTIGIFCEVLTIYLYHDTIQQFVYGLLLSSSGILVLMIISLVHKQKNEININNSSRI